MKVLLCGGGTAGHVMPAIAIAEIIKNSFHGSEIAFAGRVGGAENDAYLKTKQRLYTVDICGISRSVSFENIKSIIKIIKSSRKARNIIKEFKPDIIVGTGGYVCYPFIKQGQRMGIKTVMHESNVSPGLVTRLLGPKCDKLLLNLDGTKEYLKKSDNVLVVGNPTRKDFTALTKAEAKRRLGIPESKTLIISFGGSLGAEVMNDAVMKFIERYVLARSDIYHVHATGRAYYGKAKNERPLLFKETANVRILPYIDDMPTVLRAADIAVTRSGAITVSELSKCGTPSILIPSPNVTANHQYKNAEYMQKRGAALLIEEKELSPEKLAKEVFGLIGSGDMMKKMSENARRLTRVSTDRLIANALSDLTLK